MKTIKNVIVVFLVISVSIGLVSCEKDPVDGTTSTTASNTQVNGVQFTSTGTLIFSINHLFGNQVIQFDSTQYYTSTDTIKISELNYYLTNVTLTTENNTKVNVKNYDLVIYEPSQLSNIIVSGIPAGKYKSISFLIGVDSLRNSSGDQTGALDPANGMFWTWNTGYIFFKTRGRFGDSGSFALDIGGKADLNGAPNALQIGFDLSSYNKSGNTATLNLAVDAKKIFTTPNIYNLRVDANQIHNATNASIPKLKENIRGAFSLVSIQ